MKKTLLKGLAIASFALFVNSAMADGGSIQSISDALKDRSMALKHTSLGLSQNVNGDVTAYPRDNRGNVPINPHDGHAAHDTISVYGAYPNYTVYDTP